MDMEKRYNNFINKSKRSIRHTGRVVSNKDYSDNNTNFKIRFVDRILVAALLFVSINVISVRDQDLYQQISSILYQNVNFMKIDQFATTYFGVFYPSIKEEEVPVFMVMPEANNSRSYEDGILVEVNPYEPIQNLADGIVVKIGKVGKVENCVVIQTVSGEEYVYGNLDTIDVDLYDRIARGQTLGVSGQIDGKYYYYIAIKKAEQYVSVDEIYNTEN